MGKIILVKLLGAILRRISDPVRIGMVELLGMLEHRANETDNTWDNYLVDTLRSILGVESNEK